MKDMLIGIWCLVFSIWVYGLTLRFPQADRLYKAPAVYPRVENIDAIMAVDGLDFVLFGPADYSIAIGLQSPNKNDPRVHAAIKTTVEAADAHDKAVMIGIQGPGRKKLRSILNWDAA